MEIFRIRNDKTGLFSVGTLDRKWTKRGKVWNTKAGLSNHFSMCGYESARIRYADCTIISNDLDAQTERTFCPIQWIDDLEQRSEARRQQEEARWREQPPGMGDWAAVRSIQRF